MTGNDGGSRSSLYIVSPNFDFNSINFDSNDAVILDDGRSTYDLNRSSTIILTLSRATTLLDNYNKPSIPLIVLQANFDSQAVDGLLRNCICEVMYYY